MKGSHEEYQQLLDTYFKISDVEKEAVFEELTKDISEIPTENTERYYIYKFLTTVRRYAIEDPDSGKLVETTRATVASQIGTIFTWQDALNDLGIQQIIEEEI